MILSMKMRRASLVVCGLMACSEGTATDGRNPMGSQAMVTSSDFRALYVASADDGVVAKVDVESGAVLSQKVSGEPTRVARVGNRLLVTQRAARSVLELIDDGERLVPGRSVSVGAEPIGIAATEDGTRVYVASSMSGTVLELDGNSLDTLRMWTFEQEPRWLALHPSGHALYVGSMRGRGLAYVDLRSGASTNVDFPAPIGFDIETGSPFDLTPRVTGDLAASPDGNHVAIPAIFVDNKTPLVEPEEGDEPNPIDQGGYGGRMNPAVVVMPVDDDGKPHATEARVFAIFQEHISYPASVTFSPDSKHIVATMEGAAAVMVLQADTDFHDTGELVFESPPLVPVAVAAGPRAVSFVDDDTAHVFGFLDRRTSRFSLTVVRDQLSGDFGGDLPIFHGGEFGSSPIAIHAENGNAIATSTLDADTEAGRRMFFAANDQRVARIGAGVSCATCHFDGRADGLTWQFDRGPRQTPSLAGLVSLRAPVRWEGDRATVADDAMSTSQGLMGGSGLTMGHAQQLAAFVDYTRAVDVPLKGSDDAGVERGREIFNRADVACGSCHSGAIYSDKKLYDMLGFRGVKTPSLIGIAATAPYFHDGSAATLRSVLEFARGGAMGNTANLSEAEMQDLESYLQSL